MTSLKKIIQTYLSLKSQLKHHFETDNLSRNRSLSEKNPSGPWGCKNSGATLKTGFFSAPNSDFLSPKNSQKPLDPSNFYRMDTPPED